MLERGLQPWLTLYHWDLPQYLQEQGGWNERATAYAFAEFADVMSAHLGDRVKHWITHNEPWCTAIHGHFEGIHAPGIRTSSTALQVTHHVLLSHGLALPAIRANVPDAKVGIALSLHPLSAASGSRKTSPPACATTACATAGSSTRCIGRGYPADILALCAAAPVVLSGRPRSDRRADRFPRRELLLPRDHRPRAGRRAARGARGGARRRGAHRVRLGSVAGRPGQLLRRIEADYHPAPIYITENGSTWDDEVGADGEVDDRERRDYLIEPPGGAARHDRPRRARSRVISPGACWITSNGRKAIRAASA
jgi:beta-glucosidase